MNKTELIEKMSRLVNRTVKHYKTDFTDYDLKTIDKIAASPDSVKCLWIIRKCGTHIVYIDKKTGKPESMDYLEAVRETWPERKEYTVTYNAGTWEIKKTA